MTAREDAQVGLEKIKSAILEVLQHHPGGLRNSELADALGLRSDINGRQKDYLTYSVLGILLAEGRVTQGNDRAWQISASR